MTLKYNRVALIPHICDVCGRIFWLEPYRRNTDDHIIAVFVENICKECVDASTDETVTTVHKD